METKLRLRMIDNGNGTELAESFFSSPLKLGFPKTYGKKKQIVLMMASAGILKDDSFDYQICLEKGTNVLLTEQSYTKLFDMGRNGHADKRLKIEVAENASFYYKPCALIPFRNSSFDVDNKIYLHEQSEFAYCDIFSIGRIGMGERYAFRKLHSKTQIYINRKLAWMDHMLLCPEQIDYSNLVFNGDYTHQGLFFYYGRQEKIKRLLKTYAKLNEKREQMLWGITTPGAGICIRMLAYSAQVLEEFCSEIADLLQMED